MKRERKGLEVRVLKRSEVGETGKIGSLHDLIT